MKELSMKVPAIHWADCGSTITDKEVDSVMNVIIKKALKYDSVSLPGLS